MYQAPRGTQDILPEDAHLWAFVEGVARRQAALAGFGEIRTPTFEATAVFQRGVGATTDIVEKEMYTFLDKGGESITLRPEGTAAVMRAYFEHGMGSRPQPVKLFSLLNTFRYDRPQKGRLREFHQLDVESIGEADPAADAEVVGVHWRYYAALGLRGLRLVVNSIGDALCRPSYVEALRAYFEAHRTELCEDCNRRLATNPLRLLDDKTPACQTILDHAPASIDHLCEPCGDHFAAWTGYLAAAEIPFSVEHRLVRGLDYYSRSVWEVLPANGGAQSTLGGGGRYDGLAEQLGGRSTPGVGFATGIERILLALKEQRVEVPAAPGPRAFVVHGPGIARVQAFQLAEHLRASGIATDLALGDRKLGKQMASADRSGADVALIIGEDEAAAGEVSVKNLRGEDGGEQQRRVPRADVVAFVAEARP
ncbi:MAG: histidine--tRNA ligase [Chloroflexi bacterium]|nr:histidine--tRNA ligase [Chloroflexota bacterium]